MPRFSMSFDQRYAKAMTSFRSHRSCFLMQRCGTRRDSRVRLIGCYWASTAPRGLPAASCKALRRFGSVLQVANVFRIYVSLVDTKERNDLAEWILANIVNEYAQYGTNNHGARSLAELKEKEKASFALKRFTVTREGPPIQTSYTRRSDASAKVHNAKWTILQCGDKHPKQYSPVWRASLNPGPHSTTTSLSKAVC